MADNLHNEIVQKCLGILAEIDRICKANDMVRVLQDKGLLKTVAENTKKVDYTNKSELEKLYALID